MIHLILILLALSMATTQLIGSGAVGLDHLLIVFGHIFMIKPKPEPKPEDPILDNDFPNNPPRRPGLFRRCLGRR